MFRRILSPGLFGLVLICFFLPWINVSCQNQKLFNLSGIELATGSTPKELKSFEKQVDMFQKQFDDIFGGFGEMKKNQSKLDSMSTKPETYVLIALICVIAGIGLGFIKSKLGSLMSSIAGVVSFVFIILEKIKIDRETSQMIKETHGFITVDYLFGFYMTLILLFFAIIVNIYFFKQKSYAVAGSVQKIPNFKFCPECGTKNESANVFCKECGTKFPT